MVANKKVGMASKKPTRAKIQCEVCKQVFSRNQRLAQHLLKKHGVVWANKKKIVATPDNPRPYICDICEKTFIRRKHLQHHRVTKHIGWKCPECNMNFVKLKEHILNVHKKKMQLPYECYLCKQQYKSKLPIQTHMQAMHCNLDQQFRCPLCSEIFNSRVEYQRHRGRHKYDRGRFNKRICEKCGKKVLVSHFRNHQKTHTEGQLKCSYCEKRFRHRSSVKLHERTHTQERPYECEVCHSRFIDSSTLHIHRRNHTGESPFVCHLCGRRTKQAQNLASHYRHIHRNTDVTSKIIRFNSRVFERYTNDELERCLREDGDLARLLAAGSVEYNKEMEEQKQAKEEADQRTFEELQKQNAAARVYQKDVFSSNNPESKVKVFEFAPIEQIDVDVGAEDEFIVKCDNGEIEFVEVKVEPTLDVFNGAVDCDMSEFVEAYDIKIEEPLELNEIIDSDDVFESDSFCADKANRRPTDNSIKVETETNERPIDIEPITIVMPEVPGDKETISKLCSCHICDKHYANPSMCATHMLQVHRIQQPDIPRPHKCTMCKKSYGRGSHLWRHFEKQHGSVSDWSQLVELPIDIESISTAEDVKLSPSANKATIAKLSYCHLCDKNYANPSLCAAHMLQVHRIQQPDISRPHKCLLCEKSYGRPSHLWRHYERQHGSVPDRKMKKMMRVMRKRKINIKIAKENDEAELAAVLDSTIDEPESDMAAEPSSSQDVDKELVEVVPDRETKINIKTDQAHGNASMEIVEQMQSDPIAYNTENVKIEYLADGETAKPPTYCDICDRNYTKRSSLIVHMWGVHKIKITPPRPHKCVILTCKKSYKTRVNLLHHYRRDHGSNPERKERATKGKTTKNQKSKTGAETEAGTENANVAEIPDEFVQSKAQSLCVLCDKRYANHSACAAHMLQVHKITMPEIERPHACHVCQKSYIKRGHLVRHLKVGHRIGLKRMGKEASGFECYLCHEPFKFRNMLRKHTNKWHLPIERSSICPTCGISTRRLGRHIYSVHTLREVQCHICQRVYPHPSRLTNHMRTHTLPAQCDLCPKRFASNGQMRQHRRYHTLEKPYTCKHCGARFIERSTCTQHERIHTGEKPYQCHLCDVRTIQAGNLKSHYRHFHKMIVKRVSMTKLVTDAEMIPIM